MYSEWASLDEEIQCDTANQSVLHQYPAQVGKDVASSVVKHIAQNLSISVRNAEASPLGQDKEVKWTMEVLCYGLSLPLSEHETIRDCVNIYCEWLTGLTTPKPCVPTPVLHDPNPYAQDMLHHLLNLFVPRPGSGLDLVKRQALLCHRVLRSAKTLAADSIILTRESWEVLLKVLLAANDSLLSPPTEKDDISDHLCERVLSVLFEIWLLACTKSFPSPSLWKTFRVMCISWRHHEALVLQWHRVNHALTSILLKNMYGPEYPELIVSDEDQQLVLADMTPDCVAQSWFRFLHVIQNPVDMCKPDVISQAPRFMHMALQSETLINPSQHECLKKLPVIFFKAMRGVSIMVNAFLGIQQSVKDDILFITPGLCTSSKSTLGPGATSTPPISRKTGRTFSSVTAPLAHKVSRSSSASNNVTNAANQKLPVVTPSGSPGPIGLESRFLLAPQRPQCNSVLHLFGAWLFEAALAGTNLHPSHRSSVSAGRTSSFTENKNSSAIPDTQSDKTTTSADNTYEAGRAEACGTLCKIFCAHKTGEEILPVYLSRFYIMMYYGLQTEDRVISGQVLSSILCNSCDLLRVDLAGVQILMPYLLKAIELVLGEPQVWYRHHEQHQANVEVRKACIHLLLSMLCLPLHFKNLQIKDIVSNSGSYDEQDVNNNISFVSLKLRIIEVLHKALLMENDSSNTQMLLGGLMLMVQDLSVCEDIEQMTSQPTHELLINQDPTSPPDSTTVNGNTDGSLVIEPATVVVPEERSPKTIINLNRDMDTVSGLFVQAISLVCNRLMASWKTELNTALGAMEVLCGLAKIQLNTPNLLMCKRTVKWICDFVVYQCSRPAPAHSKDLHSMIVAAFKCLVIWLVEHNELLYDKECLHNVLEVVELGISGSKSQRRLESHISVIREKDSKKKVVAPEWRDLEQTLFNPFNPDTPNRISDIAKYKGDKQLMPASMRVKDAAEAVLNCIIDQVGAFPPPCGPESLFSLLDEKTLLKYARGTATAEQQSQFRYFVLDNSIIIGILEQPLGNVQDPLPTVTALIRGPFGRHAWTMQLRHSPRAQKTMSKLHLADPGRPMPKDNIGLKHNIVPRHFPETVDSIPLTHADLCIPTLESLVDESEQEELETLAGFIESQIVFENQVKMFAEQEINQTLYPNPVTECKPPSVCEEFQTARLLLSHYGFLSLEALKKKANSSLPPSLIMLDNSKSSSLYADLESLDMLPSRDYDTVHLFYMKSGQKTADEILANVTRRWQVQSQFLEFLYSLGWPVDIRRHAGWTGHISTSWKISDIEDIEDEYDGDTTGGSIYDGQQKVLYWADVSTEVAFLVPSPDTYQQATIGTGLDFTADKFSLPVYRNWFYTATDLPPFASKPSRSLPLNIEKSGGQLDGETDSAGSPHSSDNITMRNRKLGRQAVTGGGPDTRILVVWLENFEDLDAFPADDLLPVTGSGIEQSISGTTITTTVTPADKCVDNKNIYIIFIHALQNGLFRIHLQGHVGKMSLAIPLVDGMVVSRRTLGTLVRQTAVNICKRRRLESEHYQPAHVRRKLKTQDIVNKHKSEMTEPEFYTALFEDVLG